MPKYLGVQLAVELSNIFPVKDIVRSGISQAVSFARNLRKSGSDIVVEEDLAAVFGRGRVSTDLERLFKTQVQQLQIKPLYDGAEVELRHGPGITMRRAFQDTRYFAAVLTLSMLAYFHERSELASMIDLAMDKRVREGVDGSFGSPGYDGIINTLATCSAQSGSFHWAPYYKMVERKLQSAHPSYRYSPTYVKLSPTILTGAMDFLYLTQSLPEDRKVTVSSSVGCITFIIWAHTILGLNVRVIGCANGDITFGTGETQVFITWSDDSIAHGPNVLEWSFVGHEEDCTINLHEKDMNVILSCVPDEHRRVISIASEERHPLRGYGSVYLYRILNADAIMRENEPAYPELVGLIGGLAIHISRRLQRRMVQPLTNFQPKTKSNDELHLPITLEAWRVLGSVKMLFTGIDFDNALITMYSDFLISSPLEESTLPSAVQTLLSKFPHQKGTQSLAFRLIYQLEYLASVVILFAHVIELDKCGDVPLKLREKPGIGPIYGRDFLVRDGGKVSVSACDNFLYMAHFLCSQNLPSRNDRVSGNDLDFRYFLYSDFGWSVFLNIVGDQDPASVRPELLHLQKGVPTNSKTNEQKLRCKDAMGFSNLTDFDYGSIHRSPTYVPRAAARTINVHYLWSSQEREFGLAIETAHQILPEWRNLVPDKLTEKKYTYHGYRQMHERLWDTPLTPECSHTRAGEDRRKRTRSPTKLGPDAAAVIGWCVDEIDDGKKPEKILVLLTNDDPHLRWLALRERNIDREIMLRTDHCCEACALEYTASQPGPWILIL
jgi:hypothetical protein